MATNLRYTHNDYIYLPVPEGTRSGDPVSVGAYKGVAQIDRQESGSATVALIGSWDMTVTGAAEPGDVVNLNGTTLTTGAAGEPWGVANSSKGSGEGTLEVAPLGFHVPAAGE